jgi:hypothetical protein
MVCIKYVNAQHVKYQYNADIQKLMLRKRTFLVVKVTGYQYCRSVKTVHINQISNLELSKWRQAL